MPEEHLIIGEEKIIAMFRDEDGVGWSRSTFYNRLHKMRELGVVFTMYLGRPRRKRMCSFPSLCQKYLIMVGQKEQEGD